MAAAPPTPLVAVGSYTAVSGGRGPGITLFALDPATGRLDPRGSHALDSPSYLLWHPELPVLYAVGETEYGTVTALRLCADGTLQPLGTLPTGGADPCHLALTADGRHLLCANYSGGSLAVFALAEDGTLAGRTALVEHAGRGTDPDRQQGPHVHMAVPGPGADQFGAVDLGTDEIREYTLSGGVPRLRRTVRLPAGCGPRQLLRGEEADYVVGELDARVHVLPGRASGAEQPLPLRSAPTSARPGTNYPAHLRFSADRRFLYVSNRGVDTVTVLRTADLGPVGEFDCGGAWPRHFELIGDRLYVANQHSDTVSVLAADRVTGVLAQVGSVAVGSPACVAARGVGG
ncbi:lactonase family protein [Kitasatospora sp. LaBMicrA B282]|uniref:lactonase family protein n=1 Tax=Kitasatospora sp. LaBMicrA B282 TaxID=3420949 RepID=UPI003D0EDDA6